MSASETRSPGYDLDMLPITRHQKPSHEGLFPLRAVQCYESLLSEGGSNVDSESRKLRILDQLMHFDDSFLVVRSSGLSCRRDTSFGIFSPVSNSPGDSCRLDRKSGLMIDVREVKDICIVDWPDGPSLEFSFQRDGFAVSIKPVHSSCNCNLLDHLVERLEVKRYAPNEAGLIEAGAGAWLDEWHHAKGRGELSCDSSLHFSALLEGFGFWFKVTGELHADFRDAEIHRIAASDGRTYLFAHNSVVAEQACLS